MSSVKRLSVGFSFIAALLCHGKNPPVHTHTSSGVVASHAESAYEIYVNNAAGSDSNNGKQDRPLKTIGKALQIAQDSFRNAASVRIIISPGTYRESLSLSGTPSAGNRSISLEAEKPGTAIVSGADIWADWEPDAADPKRYVHAWPFQWGACTAPQGSPPLEEIVRRREMVLVNGSSLTQALSRDEMAEGSFFVDEPEGRVYIWPPSATNMANAVIEVPVRPRLLDVRRMSNLTVRGLSFTQANPCVSMKPAASANITGGSELLIEDSSFQWNNWGGLRLDGVSNARVRRVVADHNGAIGLAGYQLKNVTYEDVEASYNNWRGARGNIYGWDVAGAKFLRVHGVNYLRFKAMGNQTRGLWFDTDNSDVTVQDSQLSRNQFNGTFLEASQGPITIKDSRICQNGAEGVLTNNAESVSLVGNVIYGNNKAQIFINGGNKSRGDHDWETRQPYTAIAQNWRLMRNVIVGTGSQLLFEIYQSSSESSSLFSSTLGSDENTWYNSDNKKVFQLDPGGPNHSPKNVDFEQWRSNMHQDQRSTFATPSVDPASACAGP